MTKQLDCFPFGSAGYNKVFSRALEREKKPWSYASEGERMHALHSPSPQLMLGEFPKTHLQVFTIALPVISWGGASYWASFSK